jgi:hypothetical protein
VSRKRTGNLFEQLLSKSPAAADKLKRLAIQVRQQEPKADSIPPYRPSQQNRAEPITKGLVRLLKRKLKPNRASAKKRQKGYSPAGRSLEVIERDFESARTEVRRNVILISCRAYLRQLSASAKISNQDRMRFTGFYNLVGRMEVALAGPKQPKPTVNPTPSKVQPSPARKPKPVDVTAANQPRSTEPPTEPSTDQALPVGEAPDPADQTYFKSASQFESGKGGRPCDLIIGLDFGTACSKVILHSPYEQEAAFSVPFEPFCHWSNPYLLPTHISLGPDGGYYLPRTGLAGTGRDLKLKMLGDLSKPADPSGNEQEPTANQEAAIAYLGLVLKFVRAWFLKTQADAYRRLSLAWQLNLGVPSATFDEADINQLYERIGRAAWAVSVLDQPITSKTISQAWADSAGQPHKPDQDQPIPEVSVIPEIAAEVVGYARSELRQEGVHLMVDVGAGTLDVCGFILHEDEGDDKYELLTTDVQNLGAAQMDRLRRDAVRKGLEDHIDHHRNSTDPVAPISSDVHAYVPEPEPLLDRLRQAQQSFAELCMRQIKGVVVSVKTRRNPRSDVWEKLLPVFMCGGGRDASPYQELPNQIEPWLKNYVGNRGIRLIELPKPGNLRADLENGQYHRLAVAWGLSQPSFDIGKITPPSKIDDIDPNNPTGEAGSVPWWLEQGAFVSKDQV